ncbi:MAG: AAA family ATPase [Bacteroidia bacterium]
MKIRVQNLGAIRETEIELKPLTVFVGKNNTHKSYMAYAVYGVFALKDVIIRDFVRTFLLFLKRPSLQRKVAKESIQSVLLPSEFVRNRIFGKFSLPSHALRLELDTGGEEIEESKEFQALRKTLSLLREVLGNSEESQLMLSTLSELFENLYRFTISHKTFRQVFYFPASRTSFLQLRGLFIKGLVALEEQLEERLHSPLPIREFVRAFLDLSVEENGEKNKGLLRELKEIMGGDIQINPETKQVFFVYESKGGVCSLPITLSSSAVTELAPLYLYIQKNDLSDKLLIIEEPEAHLHPENQVRMARFLVKLVEAGAWVLITTHSDYIFAEINNLVRLHTLKGHSGLPADKLSVYLFEQQESSGEIQVKPVEISPEEGILSDSFDEVMNQLLEMATWIDVEFADKKRRESHEPS